MNSLHAFGSMIEQMLEQESEGFSGAFGGPEDFEINVPDILGMFLRNGRYDLGNGYIVVPDNLRPKITPGDGRTRIEIWQGVPYFEGGKLTQMLLDFVHMTPKVPWFEFDNGMTEFSLRIDPWKTITKPIDYA